MLLNKKFKLPAFEIGPTHIGPVSYINYQYNYTLPGDFTILNWQDVVNFLPTTRGDSLENYCLAIRYREDDIVHRYRFNSIPGVIINEPFYNGELIKANFVLEIWTLKNPDWGADVDMINPEDINFFTSLTYDSETEETDEVIEPVEVAEGFLGLNYGDLFLELDSDLPMVFNDKGPFLTN